MASRLQRESPSEDEPRPRNENGGEGASIAFVQWLAVQEHRRVFRCCRAQKRQRPPGVSRGGLQWFTLMSVGLKSAYVSASGLRF